MKKIIVLFFFVASILVLAQTNEVTVDAAHLQYKINKNIYGQFSEHLGHCIYGGIWVGTHSPIPNIDGIRKDVVEALREIKVPVLRWPGGCFADEYHWMNGIGPRDKRPSMINTNWGGVTENNHFGTSEFLDFCKLIGAEPYFSGNVGSGTVKELSEWVEYVNSDNVSPMTELRKKYGRSHSWGVKYWGIGNEAWGCGGNMTPEYYSDLVRRYGTFMKNYGKNRIFKIAVGPGGSDYNWTDVLMKEAGRYINGLSLHYYSFGDGKPAADFTEKGWFDIMKKSLMMETLIDKNEKIMDKYDPGKRVALCVDEWGNWFGVEPGTNPAFLFQQNTMRDAITAAANLNIFNNHCDRVRLAAIAQMVNVLQAMILTKGDKIVLTPTYYVFDLYKVNQDAMLVPTKVKSAGYTFEGQSLPAINCSASLDSTGKMHISLCNIDPDKGEKVSCDLVKFKADGVSGKILTSSKMNADNTFENPNVVMPESFSDFKLADNKIEVNMPPMSVIVLTVTGRHQLPPPIELKNPKSGLQYKYYEGQWRSLPNFNLLTSKAEGVIDQIKIPEKNSGENFGVQYEGYIKIPENGNYTFYTNSDDGSSLYIDDQMIVSNDGEHASQERSGTIELTAGFHKIKVWFFQGGGGMSLDASLEGPGLPKRSIPADMLFYEPK